MTQMFSLNWKDVGRGLVVAVLGGFFLPVLAVLQTPNFDLFHANWGQILDVALNGAVAAFAGYMVKNFFSDSQGKVFGKI